MASQGRKVIGMTVSGGDKTVAYIAKRLKFAAKLAGVRAVGPFPLPRHILKFTIQKSPFSDKKARNQYEIRTYKRLVKFDAPTMVANKFMSFIKTYLPPIAGMTEFKGYEQNFQRLSKFYSGKRTT